ncbi:MAG: tyrosine--tRNA ligase [Synergistaceae bacterium]|nr:tyrosine--tRNA ligase [Synergistaceae bacterium]
MRKNAFSVLMERGIVEYCSSPEGLKALFDEGMVTAYVGFDPTASSLHVGHLIPIMGLAWLQRLGHRPIAILGVGTGLIGDPSGKSKERNLLTLEQVEKNKLSIKDQLAHFLDFHAGENSALMISNYDWLGELKLLDFLRDTGKHFSVNTMIAREYVKSRLEDPDKSISFTEFTYMLLQAYDFYHLCEHHDCLLQMGGNDQQGNILAGVELIRKKTGKQAFCLTYPLLLTSSGSKFGKTEEGAVWLSPELTSPYRFYQFWINAEDAMVGRLLRLFTFLPTEEIDALVRSHMEHPERREAQKILAYEVTRNVHGEHAALGARRASEILFGENFSPADLDEEMIGILSKEVPSGKTERPLPLPLADLLVESGACASKGEARRLVQGGGVLLNGMKVLDPSALVSEEDCCAGGALFIRLGKKRFHLAWTGR